MKPSKAVLAGAAVAGLLTGSLAMRAYAASTPQAMPASPYTRWLTLRRPFQNTRAKVRMTARVRAVARLRAKIPAKAREAAQPTELSRLHTGSRTS